SVIWYFQEGVFDVQKDIGLNPFDPEIAISWPAPQKEYIVSDKDKAAPFLKELRNRLPSIKPPSEEKCTFLVYGAAGYFGSHVVKHLTQQDYVWKSGTARLEHLSELEKELDIFTPQFVI